MKASCWQLDRHIQPPKVDPAKRHRQRTLRDMRRNDERKRNYDWSRARVSYGGASSEH